MLKMMIYKEASMKWLCCAVWFASSFQMLSADTLFENTGFVLSSTAFRTNEEIPVLYTGAAGGKDISPPLSWSHPPKNTQSFALICLDIDPPIFGTITHWVIYNIPSDKQTLPEAVPHRKALEDGSIQGKNSSLQNGYFGPNPPWGKHRYIFRLYALDCMVSSKGVLGKSGLTKAMQGHIVGEAELTGTFTKRK
jgi:Raf kinase inhibitor-like YbhB/YbcL family protein